MLKGLFLNTDRQRTASQPDIKQTKIRRFRFENPSSSDLFKILWRISFAVCNGRRTFPEWKTSQADFFFFLSRGNFKAAAYLLKSFTELCPLWTNKLERFPSPKVSALSKSASNRHTIMCPTLVSQGLTHKHWAWPEKFAGVKHFSLFHLKKYKTCIVSATNFYVAVS